MKYTWFLRSGQEQLFDLTADPEETTNLIGNKKYAAKASEMRRALADHLSERGDEWVRDGKLQTRSTTLLYSPNFPKN